MLEFSGGLCISYNPCSEEFGVGWVCQTCRFPNALDEAECVNEFCGEERPKEVSFIAMMAQLEPFPRPLRTLSVN